jgi:biotin operon repressor
MKVFEYLDRINRMQKLMEQQHTGTPNEFAGKLGVSRTSLYELIDELRSRGAPILYSKSARTFYYDGPFRISITCDLRPIDDDEEKNYSGGTYFSRILFFRTLDSDLSVVTLPC